jgi:hypothetical protein
MGMECSTKRNTYRIMVGKPEGNRPLRTPKVGGWLNILKWILRYDGVVWTGLIWLRIGTSKGLL